MQWISWKIKKPMHKGDYFAKSKDKKIKSYLTKEEEIIELRGIIKLDDKKNIQVLFNCFSFEYKNLEFILENLFWIEE